MRVFFFAALCLALCAPPTQGQTADSDPATKDDIILLFRTMRSFDLMQRMMEVQSKSMQQLMRDQIAKDKGDVPADFDARWKKAMDDLVKGMPVNDMTQAMIPAYQNHFTRSDIQAMNTFYSSPVGQKVLQELPVVTQEGLQEMMPILSKYLSEWKDRLAEEFKSAGSPSKSQNSPASQK